LLTLSINTVFFVSIQVTISHEKILAQEENPEMQKLLDEADSLVNQTKYQEAITYYDNALSIDPKNVVALQGKALALQWLGNNEDAINYFDKALEIDQKNIFLLYSKGFALEGLGRYEEAISYYDKALEIDPNFVDALYSKGFALNSLSSALHDPERGEEAISSFDKALGIDPANVNALYGKGLALHNYGNYEEAINYFDKALEIFPDDGNVLNSKGWALNDANRYEEAITYFDKVLALYPDDINALSGKAVTLHDIGRIQDAITYYDKVLKIDPNDVDALNNKIAALGKLTPDFTPTSFSGNAYDHLQYIYISSSLNETSAIIINSDAATCENIKKLVDTALNLKPDDVKILTNGGLNLAQKCGKYEESITYYDRALAVNASYVPALYNKGVSLDKIGNHEEEAQGLFEKAKDLDPNYKTDFIVGAPRLAEPLPSPI